MIAALPVGFGKCIPLGAFGGLGLLALAGCASRQEAGVLGKLASAPVEQSDAVKYCPDGQAFLEKNLDTGATFIATYKIDGNFCLIETNDFVSRTIFGAIPPERYTNINQINDAFGSILMHGKETQDFDETGSSWGRPSIAHVRLTKTNEDPVTIDNLNYPTKQLDFFSSNTRDQKGHLIMKFSYLTNGKIFASRIEADSPEHGWRTIQVIDVINQPIELR